MPTLDWLNRDAAFRITAEVPYRMLELVSEHMSSSTDRLHTPSPTVIGREQNKDSSSKNNENDSQAQVNWGNDKRADSSSPQPKHSAATHDTCRFITLPDYVGSGLSKWC